MPSIKKTSRAALKKLKQLAEKGHAKAQNKLGEMYGNGKRVPRDYKEAAKWYQLAGEQEFANAQFRLGLLYEKGKGIYPKTLSKFINDLVFLGKLVMGVCT